MFQVVLLICIEYIVKYTVADSSCKLQEEYQHEVFVNLDGKIWIIFKKFGCEKIL